jgi:hypothetical protein
MKLNATIALLVTACLGNISIFNKNGMSNMCYIYTMEN